MWHAKITGGYGINTQEAKDNIQEMNWMMNVWGYTLESQAGILGNMMYESHYNPWKWQNDRIVGDYANGYGLLQYTPARRYFSHCEGLQYYSPSLSTSEETPGATPQDGICQMVSMNENLLHDWVSTCWSGNWDKEQLVDLWENMSACLEEWGTNGRLQWSAYKTITDERDAALLFMGGYLRPGRAGEEPNWRSRRQAATTILPMLTHDLPPTPGQSTSKMIYYLRPLWWNSIRNGRR